MNEVSKQSGWKKYILIGSLCVNVLVIGLMVGNSLKPHSSSKMRGSKGDGFGAFAKALPSEKRQELRKRFESERSGFRKNREQTRQIRAKMRAAIIAIPFDKDALSAIFTEQSTLRAQQSVVGDQVWVELIASMTDEQRAEFVAAIEGKIKKSRN